MKRIAKSTPGGRSLLLAVASLGAAFTPPAAQAEDDDAASFELAQLITVIGRRPSYAPAQSATPMRTETPLRDTPQSVTVITRDLIEDQGMRSMADVVRYAPGVSMGQGEGHRDAPTLRGNSSTADFFVDGLRDDVQYFRDLYNAERIEVLKGANAMIFGRGGGGGVINRVTKSADWATRRDMSVQIDTDGELRGEADLSLAFSEALSARANLMAEDSETYRDFVSLERVGVNPSAAWRFGNGAELHFGYEYFSDERTVDRGVPSQNGRPARTSRSAYFGNPTQSFSDVEANLFSAGLDYAFSPTLRLRSRLLVAEYDKYYQNVHANTPVGPTGLVTLQAYLSGTQRENAISQTDLIWETQTGGIDHTFVFGVEFAQQDTANTRTPNNNAAGVVSITNPTSFAPVNFGAVLQSNNQVDAQVAALYIQDQIDLTDQLQLVAGLRYDRFELDFNDLRAANADFSRSDDLLSPRIGLVYKPIEPLSLYASYSVSYLPQSGDQFSSLDATSAALEPEEFENIEVGLKWDVAPDLALTAAIYRLERTNTRAIDPLTSRTVLSGAQRSEGFELGLAGAVTPQWDVIAGYGYQNVEITATTTAAPAGRVVPLTPEHVFSLWNNYHFGERYSAGLGVIHQSESFASISNAVTLPEFTRVDAAFTVTLSEHIEAQLNIENLFDEAYWATAHNDNNITPGAPRLARLTLRTRF